MPYNFDKSDGSKTITVQNGEIVSSRFDTELVGINATGYALPFATNSFWNLENFSATTPPTKQIQGQLWFDKNTDTMRVWVGDDAEEGGTGDWVQVGGKIADTIEPATAGVDIGLSTNPFGTMYTDNIHATNAFYDVETVQDLQATKITSPLLLPSTNGSGEIGQVGSKWGDGYINNLRTETLTFKRASTQDSNQFESRLQVSPTLNRTIVPLDPVTLGSEDDMFEAIYSELMNGGTFSGTTFNGDTFTGTTFNGTTFTGTANNADKLDNLDSTQYLRSDVNDDFTAQFLNLSHESAQLTFDDQTAPDGRGVKRLTCNDGAGNFNSRLGNYFSNGAERYTTTGSGAAAITMNGETLDGSIYLRAAPIGNADDPVAWNTVVLTTVDFTHNGNKIWTAGNDGAGSGLDADLLDGINSSQFLRSDTSDQFTAGLLTINNRAGDLISNGGQVDGLQMFQPTAGADAMMTFHVGGDYALHFGLDGTTNDLAVGGWSKGAVNYKIWHQGNDGAGSGLDADLLDGHQLTTSASGSTVAERDSAADVHARLFRSNYQTEGGISTAATLCFRNNTSDNYIRHGTRAAVLNYLGITSGSDTFGSNTGQGWFRSSTGMIINFGVRSFPESSNPQQAGVTFYASYPTACVAMVTTTRASNGYSHISSVGNVTTTGATIGADRLSSGHRYNGVYWIAIGY